MKISWSHFVLVDYLWRMSAVYILGIVLVCSSFSDGYSARSRDVLLVEEDVIEEITCWTCPNKTDNEACNDWAPDVRCPTNHTTCKTVHHVHVLNLESIRVTKMCVPQHECTEDVIGCFKTHMDNIMECVSCCVSSYCNEFVPFNHTTALSLSSFRPDPLASSSVRHLSSRGLHWLLGIILLLLLVSPGEIETHQRTISDTDEKYRIHDYRRAIVLDTEYMFSDKLLLVH